MANEVYVKYVSVDSLGMSGNYDRTELAVLIYSHDDEVMWMEDWTCFEEMREAVNPKNIGHFIYDTPYLYERFWSTIEQTNRVIWRNWPESAWVETPVDPQKVVEEWEAAQRKTS
jgi:hypothetical protein